VNLLAGEAEIGSGGCARSKRLADEYALFVGAAACLKGLRVYLAEGDTPPVELLRPPSLKKYWTRRCIAEWLVDRLSEDSLTLAGMKLPIFARVRNDFRRLYRLDK